MGGSKNSYFRVGFNQKLKIGFRGTQVTSDGGLVVIREMDQQLGLTKIAGEYLKDNRHGKNIQHEMEGLLRQSVYSRLGGYEDTNDAEGLRKDPGMRAVIENRALAKAGAGETTVGRFEKEILLEGDNLNNLDEILQAMNREGRFSAWYEGNNIGHRQFREPGVWGTGRIKLQRTFSLKVLPPIIGIQPVRRLP